jgi:hypothetical protein
VARDSGGFRTVTGTSTSNFEAQGERPLYYWDIQAQVNLPGAVGSMLFLISLALRSPFESIPKIPQGQKPDLLAVAR